MIGHLKVKFDRGDDADFTLPWEKALLLKDEAINWGEGRVGTGGRKVVEAFLTPICERCQGSTKIGNAGRSFCPRCQLRGAKTMKTQATPVILLDDSKHTGLAFFLVAGAWQGATQAKDAVAFADAIALSEMTFMAAERKTLETRLAEAIQMRDSAALAIDLPDRCRKCDSPLQPQQKNGGECLVLEVDDKFGWCGKCEQKAPLGNVPETGNKKARKTAAKKVPAAKKLPAVDPLVKAECDTVKADIDRRIGKAKVPAGHRKINDVRVIAKSRVARNDGKSGDAIAAGSPLIQWPGSGEGYSSGYMFRALSNPPTDAELVVAVRTGGGSGGGGKPSLATALKAIEDHSGTGGAGAMTLGSLKVSKETAAEIAKAVTRSGATQAEFRRAALSFMADFINSAS